MHDDNMSSSGCQWKEEAKAVQAQVITLMTEESTERDETSC